MRVKPLGGPYVTRTTVLAGLMVGIMAVLVLFRFIFGLGSVTNLNNGFPWGLWLAYDMVAGSAIGCGGYAVALVVYALNRGQYHALMRPAILASMFGYALGGISVMVDMSRWWNAWHIFWPGYFNLNSVLIEVALCVSVYTMVLMLEFAPPVVEKLVEWTGRRGGKLHAVATKIETLINKTIFVFIALGMTLPTMHQSSLGTMLIPVGPLLNPLWQTPFLPALFLLTALCIGYGVVMLEATLVSDRFARPSEAHLLALLSRYLIGAVILFLAIRWGSLGYQGKLHFILTSGALSFSFFAENGLFLIPLVLLWSKQRRLAPRYQFVAAMCILAGGILYRLDAYLIAYGRAGWHYFPSVSELMVTFGMIAVEVLGYVLIVKFFPVLPAVEHAHRATPAIHRSVA